MSHRLYEVEPTRHVAYELIPATSSIAPAFTFVCLPSMGDGRAEYRAIVPKLTSSGQVLLFDHRGMGDSDANFASYTPLDTSNDLVKLVIHLDLRNIVFLACSFSAASVIPASLELKDRVKGVVFLSPFAWDHPMPFGVPTLLWATLRSCTGQSIWSSYYRSLYKIEPSPVADITEYCAALAAKLGQPGRLAALRGQVFAEKAPCAARIPAFVSANIPWTVVYGSKDPDFPSVPAESTEFLQRFAAATPFAPVPGATPSPDKLLMIEGAGHYPHAEAPAAVAAHIAKFVATLKK